MIPVSGTATQAAQTITFPVPVTEPVYPGGGATLSATATSGLPVGFLSTTTKVCTVSGSSGAGWSVSFIAVGQCSIEAYQWGNSSYAAAHQAFQNFYVHGLPQTITVVPLAGTLYAGSSTTAISASATSTLEVTFASRTSSTCTVSNTVDGWQLTTGGKGTCTIVATQPGNNTYAPAAPVTTTIQIHGNTQSITFPAIVEPVYVGGTVTLGATASSTLPVSYGSSHPAFCTVSQSSGVWSVNLLKAGTCSIMATQAGNSNFAAATNVNQNFYVHPTP